MSAVRAREFSRSNGRSFAQMTASRLLGSTALIPAAGLMALMPSQAFAQTWDGGGPNPNFDEATNWNPNGVPAAGGTIQINGAGGPNADPLVNANTNAYQRTEVTAATLTIAATLNSAFTVVSGTGTVNVQATGSISGDVLASSGGTIANAGTIGASLIVNGGTVTNTGVVSGFTGINSGTLTLNAGSNLANGQGFVVNGGTVNLNTEETIALLDGLGGTINFGLGSRLIVSTNLTGTYSGGFSGESTFNQSYLAKFGTGTLTLAGTSSVTGSGIVQISAGRIVVRNGNAIGDSSIVSIPGTAVFELQGDETIGALAVSSTGSVALNQFTLTLGGLGTPITAGVDGVISGTGGLTHNGSGLTTIFSAENTFSGTLRVSAGTVRVGGNDRFASGSSLLVDGGTYNTAGFNNTFAGVTLDGGSITSGGIITSNSAFDMRSGTVEAVLAGSVGLNKTTAGTVTLSSTNTYTGQTTISAGTLIAANGSALGTTDSGTTVNSGATLGIQGGVTIGDAITISGEGASGIGALRSISGDNLLTGSITLAADASIVNGGRLLQINGLTNNNGNLLTAAGSGSTAIGGAISGSGGLTKVGVGQVDLNGTNTYTGTTTVNSGVMVLNSGSAIIDTGRVVVNGGAFATFLNETIGSLEGGGGIVTTSAGSGTVRLTVGGNNLSTTYSGGLVDNAGGRFALTKIGIGTLTLSGLNTHSGLTTVSQGTLTVTNGSALGTGDNGTVVESGATLHLSGAFDNRTEAVTINGFGFLNAGALRSSGGSNGFSLTAVTLGSDARINSNFELSLTSVIGGGNALTLGGTGNLFINNNLRVGFESHADRANRRIMSMAAAA
jgi:autotransporter-associated beta strand protein